MFNRNFYKRVNDNYNAAFVAPTQHIWIDRENYIFNLRDDDEKALWYKPNKTALEFHKCNDKVRGMIGCYGSGKTTAMLAEIIFRTYDMPVGVGGKRYSRWAIIRNTYAELESTTYVSWCAWFSNLGNTSRNKKPLLTMRHNYNDDLGEVELEIIFIALDSESDVRKLKSLEVSGIYINEASEIQYAVFEHAMARVGRYLLNQIQNYWHGVIFDTNPPNRKHWIPILFEDNKHEEHVLFHQPPGLIKDEDGKYITNPEADNLEHLQKNYYLNNSIGKTEEYIKVFCLGEYGSLLTGKAVYHEYNDDLHSIEKIELNPLLPVYVGMDFGLTPAAVFLQVDKLGRYLIVKELVSEQLGIAQFIENIFSPWISTNLNGFQIDAIVGDPAGEKKNENDMTSCFDILHQAGFYIVGANTNLITPRLEAVRSSLNSLVEGKPKFLLSRTECQFLREGLLGGYSYKKLKVLNAEIYDSKPDKNQYSHIQDALQYVILYLNNISSKPKVTYQFNEMRF